MKGCGRTAKELLNGNHIWRLLVKHDLYSYLYRLQKRFEVRSNGWSDGPPESLGGSETRIRHSAGNGAGESSRLYQWFYEAAEGNIIDQHTHKLLKQINKEVKVTRTEYYTTFIKIWQSADNREGAHATMQEQLDPELSYKKMISKYHYVQKRGVILKKLERDIVDWDQMIKTFSS